VIEADAAGKLRLVNDPAHSPVWAVIPTSAPKDIDLHALFLKSSEARALSASAPRPVRFRRWFWASFIKPLELEHRRWILSERFTDLPKPEEPPEEGSIEVLAAEIALTDPDAIADEAKVTESIQKWAVRTGISLDRFRDRVNENAEKITRQARMALAFESLDPEDQKRIVIPLDIVMKLLRH
jgi:hypothetical protein